MQATETNDARLWHQVLSDDSHAFEQVVTRHQAAVSAVSFSCLGDFAASEDIAQETFLVAWQSRDQLDNSGRLRAWLCGIARNLARSYQRTRSRRLAAADASNLNVPLARDELRAEADAPTRAMAREEQELVWSTLESISETYREPLVLFYREGHSVAAIAEALDISEATAKQRLSRGRALLRESVAQRVGDVLEQTRPDERFTASVMASLGTSGLLKSAWTGGTTAAGVAKTTATLAPHVASTSIFGVLGGLLGAAGGLLGAWFGTWLPTQLAETKNERALLELHGRRMMRRGIIFTAIVLAASLLLTIQGGWLVGVPLLGIATIWFMVTTIASTLQVNRRAQQIRADQDPNDAPNDTPLKQWANQRATRYEGRNYRSKASLLGLPLLDVQVSDPSFQNRTAASHAESSSTTKPVQAAPRKACGWIAIGDHATGLIAVGGTAFGLFAFGGRAVGLVSGGGLAVGGIAIGGAGLGIISLSGLALGLWSIGGLALGWQAAGGVALGWQCAAGGGAIGWVSAIGGGALAKLYAVGGSAIALHANDAVAREFLNQQTAKQWLDAFVQHQFVGMTVIALVSISPMLGQALMYRRVPNISKAPDASES